ncbi:hypothetical protein ACFVHB_39025 [Kitasatospora sp. NPDC127111]|uniref:hypothetical protein n=1 Tax=Kitasatospora sp. NPDC127111 TaxID=3345363 RepID=UPI00362E0D22
MRIRPLAVALALAGAAVLGPAALPAAAHGDTVRLDVTGQENGHVTTVATFENDHDPVTQDFAGTLSASSADGRSAGPWRLVAVPGRPGTYTTKETLPAGHWRVTVDCAFPDLGHGERELDVEAAAITDPVLPTPPATGPAPTPAPPAPPATGPTTGPTAAPTAAPVTGPTATVAAPVPGVTAAATTATTQGPGNATAAARSSDADGTSDAATWAAIGTAVAAVLLVSAGFWLRRRARGN